MSNKPILTKELLKKEEIANQLLMQIVKSLNFNKFTLKDTLAFILSQISFVMESVDTETQVRFKKALIFALDASSEELKKFEEDQGEDTCH